MKNLLASVAISTVVSVICIPLTIVGMGIGGWAWGEIEPILKKK